MALILCCCLVIYPVLKLCIACCYTDKKAAVVPLETVDIETNLKKRLAISLKQRYQEELQRQQMALDALKDELNCSETVDRVSQENVVRSTSGPSQDISRAKTWSVMDSERRLVESKETVGWSPEEQPVVENVMVEDVDDRSGFTDICNNIIRHLDKKEKDLSCLEVPHIMHRDKFN